ncbi:MAG TPA: prephenate dehydrogenase/arogenate dehydrogenase family protein [Solirubrobacteraceae bacterium]|nr:prephenate dehydrogenase/arogenate dehydrogenase family protein [Solirubrobacteraceae bacterium]
MAILGVGLIGGSIGLAARERAGAEVCGYDPDERVRAEALALGALDTAAGDLAAAVDGAEVVFAAAPVGALAEVVTSALEAAGPDCVVSDVGSTKRLLADAAGDERFIGGHPLAGAETAGVEHARADMFEGATWYLTPATGATAGVLYERLHRLLGRLGARPVAIDAATHDRMMACVSHLPHVLANLLVDQAAGVLAGGRPQAGADGLERLPAVGPSFRDATRVAGANSAIWTDIYVSNRDALADGIEQLERRLAQVRGWLADGDAGAVGAWNERARAERDALLAASLTGAGEREPVHELRVSVPNRPGVIAEIALALGDAGVNILDLVLSPSPDNSQGVVALWIAGEQRAGRAAELVAGLGFPVARA